MGKQETVGPTGTVQEAAGRWRVDDRTIYRMIKRGQLPAYKLGRVYRLDLDEVDRAIRAAR